jgi:myxalamid-type nonribosomal peptide synthetase MxaA
VYRLSGPLDAAALEEAFASLVARHEALRASLDMRGGELMMDVHSHVQTPLSFVDVGDRPASEREAAVQRYVGEQLRKPFVRTIAPLLRATLIRVETDEYVLVVIIDHIVSDGWSVDVLARDLSRCYRQALGEVRASPPAMQYPDFAARQWEQLTEERLDALAGFYGRLFPHGPSDMAVRLPGYHVPSSATSHEPLRGVPLDAGLGRDATEGLRSAARKLRVTLFVLTATVFAELLQRESDQERITLSTSFAGRTGPGEESMIGYLARTVWVPTTLSGTRDLTLDARTFQSDMLGVIDEADIPPRVVFDRIWGANARAEMDLVPQADFLCAPFWAESLELPGIRVEASEAEEGIAEGAVSIYLTDRGSHIDAQLRFPPERLGEAYARSVFEDYLARLQAISAKA